MAFCDLKTLYSQPPPPFGKELLPHFALDPEYVNLNNGAYTLPPLHIPFRFSNTTSPVGSYGSPPKAVLQAALELSHHIELNPDRFHRYEYIPQLKEVRAQLAKFIGAETDEVFLVTNATTGVNTVLRNFHWEEGDLIINCAYQFSFDLNCSEKLTVFVVNTSYAAIRGQVAYLADAPPNPRTLAFPILFPTSSASILERFRAFLKSPEAQVGKNNKRVVVIDSIISNPGIKLPWEEMVEVCREEGVWSVVDAAHSVGQEKLDLGKAKPDFWTSVSCSEGWSVGYRLTSLDDRIVISGSGRRGLLRCYTFRSGKGSAFLDRASLKISPIQEPAHYQDDPSNIDVLHTPREAEWRSEPRHPIRMYVSIPRSTRSPLR